MIERSLDLKTADGDMSVFIAHPDRYGPHPVVIFLMDAQGIREELRDMVRRLASAGYWVIMPNMYYRLGFTELPADVSHDTMRPMLYSLSIEGVMADCDACLALAASDPAASSGKIGVTGYCMSGQYAMHLAGHLPDRVAAAASFHGVRMVTDSPRSPHLDLPKAKAEFYFGCAELDEHAPLDMVRKLDAAMQAWNVRGEVEILPGLHHGFVFPERAGCYDKQGAETHWERLNALLRRNLFQPG